MATKSFQSLKKNFILETNFVTNFGYKVFIYPFIERSKISICCFVVLCSLLCIVILQLIVTLIVSKFKDWFEIINVAPNLGVCVLILIKYVKIHTNRNLYDDILNHFRIDVWDVIDSASKKHKTILRKYTNMSRMAVRFLYYYMIVLVFIVNLFPRILMVCNVKILGNDLQYLYPYDGWYPFDKIKWYNTVYVWEGLMTTIVVVLFVFNNVIHSSYTMYICMELMILGSTIEDLISSQDCKNISKRICVKETHDKIRMNLKTIIERHQFLNR